VVWCVSATSQRRHVSPSAPLFSVCSADTPSRRHTQHLSGNFIITPSSQHHCHNSRSLSQHYSTIQRRFAMEQQCRSWFSMSWKQMLGKERHIPRVQLQLSTTAHIFFMLTFYLVPLFLVICFM